MFDYWLGLHWQGFSEKICLAGLLSNYGSPRCRTVSEYQKEVPNTFAYPCDVSDEAAVNDMASQVVEEIGNRMSFFTTL